MDNQVHPAQQKGLDRSVARRRAQGLRTKIDRCGPLFPGEVVELVGMLLEHQLLDEVDPDERVTLDRLKEALP